ncbi:MULTISPECIES: hypothetical protein [unclassified Lysinibacillus]|uniref:hypothetical protein n=1 Tax=unclassified Lysinibacillus TaxID=2636778 RepID=UPI0020C9058F|nr:hypothetical protein [Lysinibacillus sp. SG55]
MLFYILAVTERGISYSADDSPCFQANWLTVRRLDCYFQQQRRRMDRGFTVKMPQQIVFLKASGFKLKEIQTLLNNSWAWQTS